MNAFHVTSASIVANNFLAFAMVLGRGLLVITKPKLMTTREPSPYLQSQRHVRSITPGCSRDWLALNLVRIDAYNCNIVSIFNKDFNQKSTKYSHEKELNCRSVNQGSHGVQSW